MRFRVCVENFRIFFENSNKLFTFVALVITKVRKMNYKKAIYKEREVDLTATVEQLDVHEAVKLPVSPQFRISAIRTAISRINNRGEARFSVSETINYAVITRTI